MRRGNLQAKRALPDPHATAAMLDGNAKQFVGLEHLAGEFFEHAPGHRFVNLVIEREDKSPVFQRPNQPCKGERRAAPSWKHDTASAGSGPS